LNPFDIRIGQGYDVHALVPGRKLNVHTHAALLAFARAALGDAANASWKRKQYAVMTQNALRQLIAVSPELQTA